MTDVRIEYPSIGATYRNMAYGVYEYGEHPRYSVLYGRERRTFLDSFPTLAEAVAAYPQAEQCLNGTGFREDNFMDLSDSEEPDDYQD